MVAMPKRKLPPAVLEFFRLQGAKGGKIGGKRSLATMTPEQRSERARKASRAAARARQERTRTSKGKA
jgi:hypothetical protein